MPTYMQDPDATLDYAFDWTGWLTDGETITSHTVTATGATVDRSTISGGVVTAWLSGVADGARATVVCEIVTDAGRTDDRTITVVGTQR